MPTTKLAFTGRISGTRMPLASGTTGSNSLVKSRGVVWPSPVTNIRSVSPGRAGLASEAKDPSGLTKTARITPSVSVNWKIPGLYSDTVTLFGALNGADATLSTVTTSEAAPGAGISQGTWNDTDSCPFTFATS